jgi:hypothetical protein
MLALQMAGMEFPIRHEHLRKGCDGTMTVDDAGIRFDGGKGHVWSWKYEDIQQLTLLPAGLNILTYKDSKLRLGADVEFKFAGELPSDELFREWSVRLDQRFVAGQIFELTGERMAAKRLGMIQGSEGSLIFGEAAIGWQSARESRRWRYQDIQNVSSAGPFQLTITTFEKQFDFQLKQPISETRYNQLWLEIERKNGKIQ